MRITVLSAEGNRFFGAITEAQREADAARMPGLHLSAIVEDFVRTCYPEDYQREGISEPTKRMYFEAGNAIEDLLARAFVARMKGWRKPEPRQCEGIWCAADGESPASDTIDEIKATWKSAKDFQGSVRFRKYVMQGLGYLYAYDRTRLRVHVFHMNGDWRPPMPWPPQTYIVKPTGAEIVENWRQLRQHAQDRKMLRKGA